MSQATFSLQRFRFDNVSANAPDPEGVQGHELEMKFLIGFHSEAPENYDFAVTVHLQLRRNNGDVMEDVMTAQARGAYQFTPDTEPYSIEDPLERTYAVSLLYGCMRPTLDAIINGIGFTGLILPISLPLEVVQAGPVNAVPGEPPNAQ